jgi:hypothetical protein
MWCGIFSESCKPSGYDQRNHEKEAQREDGGELYDIVTDEVPYTMARRLAHFPDCIQGVLKLNYDPDGCEDQRP